MGEGAGDRRSSQAYEAWPGAAARALCGEYRRREPEKTALHRVVRENLADLLAEARGENGDGWGLPTYVEREFESYLGCGLLTEGFTRVVCRECGQEKVVAHSCKRRGVCPSCTARRAHEAAAHLVDFVVPRVPVRQWVLSFPKRLRYVLARDTELLGAVVGSFLKCVFSFHRRRARELGVRGGQGGAVTFLQWFGSALQLTPHAHSAVPDGVFVEEDTKQAPVFHRLPAPTSEELDALLLKVVKRVHALFSSRGFFNEDADGAVPLGYLERAQLEAARGQGALPLGLQDGARAQRRPGSAFLDGFSLHAGVRLHANDREGLERLCLYGGRGALAEDRVSVLPDGRVSYRMKRPAPDGQTHLVCTGVEFLRHLASITPPPRVNLLRFHGVFAPNSKLRSRIVPRPEPEPECVEGKPKARQGALELAGEGIGPPTPRTSAVPWAELIKRTFRTDVLQCQRCGGRMRVLAFVTDPHFAAEVLTRLGLPSRTPARASSTGPPQLSLALGG